MYPASGCGGVSGPFDETDPPLDIDVGGGVEQVALMLAAAE